MPQVAFPGELPGDRVHWLVEGVNVPVEFVVKLTVPVGTVGLNDVSRTLTIQLLV